jgi:hypothetical protein
MSNCIKENKWSIEYDNAPGELSFNYKDCECLKSTGVELGILLEKYGFEEKNRLHKSDKNDFCWIETETKHPFGAEPVIKHKYEIAGNHTRVTTDIQISHQLPMENIVIDSLLMPGEWDKIEVFQFDTGASYKISSKEYNAQTFSEIKFESIPLIILLSKEDGSQIEIGCGYDLWRWNIADIFDAKSEFILSKVNEGITFIRKVADWKEEYTMQRRNFRFSWYFAWGNKNDKKNETTQKTEPINKLVFKNNKLIANAEYNNDVYNFTIDPQNLPQNILKDSSNDICFCSRTFFNTFKHWLRVLYNENEFGDYTINLTCLKPGICSKSNHVASRAKKKQLHFDYLYLFGIWEWANQCLGDSDINFTIDIDDLSMLKDLPSAVGLRSKF